MTCLLQLVGSWPLSWGLSRICRQHNGQQVLWGLLSCLTCQSIDLGLFQSYCNLCVYAGSHCQHTFYIKQLIELSVVCQVISINSPTVTCLYAVRGFIRFISYVAGNKQPIKTHNMELYQMCCLRGTLHSLISTM